MTTTYWRSGIKTLYTRHIQRQTKLVDRHPNEYQGSECCFFPLKHELQLFCPSFGGSITAGALTSSHWHHACFGLKQLWAVLCCAAWLRMPSMTAFRLKNDYPLQPNICGPAFPTIRSLLLPVTMAVPESYICIRNFSIRLKNIRYCWWKTSSFVLCKIILPSIQFFLASSWVCLSETTVMPMAKFNPIRFVITNKE